jgi:uncharacterized Zn finger protein
MKDLSRKIPLHCPVCGNDQFSSVDDSNDNLSDAPDETKIKCSDCGAIHTKAELINENQNIINANIEDVKREALKELKKQVKKAFRKLK